MKKMRWFQQGVLSFVFMAAVGGAFSQMGGGMGPGGDHGHDPGSLPGWQGHEIEHNIVLPQVAVGDRVNMTLILTNMGGPHRMGWFEDQSDYSVTGTIRFFSEDGSPLSVKIGEITAAEFPFSLDASEVSFLDIFPASVSELQLGWLLIEVDDDADDWGFMDGHAVARGERVMVSAYYSIFDQEGELASQAAVQPTMFRQAYYAQSIVTAQFRQTESGPLRTGLAVVNTGNQIARITLRLVSESGNEMANRSLNLASGSHMAQFVDELFPSISEDFRGILELSADVEGIVSMGLLQTGLVTTSLPTHHYGSWMQYQ